MRLHPLIGIAGEVPGTSRNYNTVAIKMQTN